MVNQHPSALPLLIAGLAHLLLAGDNPPFIYDWHSLIWNNAACWMQKLRKYHWKIAAGIKPPNIFFCWISLRPLDKFSHIDSQSLPPFFFGLVGWQAAYHCQHLLHCPLCYLLSSVLLIDFSVNTVYVPVIFLFLHNIKFRNTLNYNLFPPVFLKLFFSDSNLSPGR